MVALKTLFAPSGTAAADGTYELRLGEHRFRARVDGDRFAVERGGADAPDAIIAADPPALAGALWHGRPLALSPSPATAAARTRFLRRFPLP